MVSTGVFNMNMKVMKSTQLLKYKNIYMLFFNRMDDFFYIDYT